MLHDLVEHRRFVLANAWAETRHRYAGTAMGAFWHVVQPLALIVLFAFLFSNLFPSRYGTSSRMGPLIYIMSGMLTWQAFAECVSRCTTALTDNAHYLRKIALPEILFVARTAVATGIMMTIAIVLVITGAMVLGSAPSWAWLSIPVAGLMLTCFGFGCGLILAPIHVFARDTGQAIGIVMQFWMWLSPVVMAEEMLPQVLRQLQTINPAYYFIRAIRRPLVDGHIAEPTTWLVMLGLTAITIMLGHRMLKHFVSDVRDAL